jgi:hypothetical protein
MAWSEGDLELEASRKGRLAMELCDALLLLRTRVGASDIDVCDLCCSCRKGLGGWANVG